MLVDPASLAAASPPVAGAGANGASAEAIPDFSAPARRVRFRIDGDVFEGPRDLPAEHALAFIARAQALQLSREEVASAGEQLRELFELVLVPASLERFTARLSDPEAPISLAQIPQVISYLFEAYGMRPTPPSSGSASGSDSPDDGTSSTAEPPPPAPAIPDGSPSPAS